MSSRDNDTSYIAESLPAFISEAEEHIEMLEQLLLQLEGQPGDRELLDALFRSAHTIKGSAGIFGLDGIVAFTHVVENILDGVQDVVFNRLTAHDVVRHKLVGRIVAAYDEYDARGGFGREHEGRRS